jgi:hypothetical protein
MENKVKLISLKRQEIRKTILNGDSPIIIYNPSPEKQNEIKKIINNNFKNNYQEININSINLIVKILPMLTNIDLGLDISKEEDKKILEEIINDPSDEFVTVFEEISKIIEEVGKHYIYQLNTFAKLPKEQMEKLLQINQTSEISEKEKRKRELQKQLEELEKEGV